MVASMVSRIRFLVRRLLPALLLAPAFAMAQSADIVVNHSDSPDPGAAGGIFTYTLRLDNNGPNDAANVRLSDTLPAGSAFVDATPSAGSCAPPAGGVVNCTVGNIPYQGSQTVTVRVKLPTAGVYTNTVTSTSDTSDPNPGNNTSNRQDTTATSASDLKMSVAAPATITAGQPFNYTLTAQNLGPDAVPADGTITISFTVPAGASVTALPSGSGWSCTPPASGYPKSSGAVTCTRSGPLASGASAPALTVAAVTNVDGAVTGAFSVASTMPDGDLGNNTATASVASAAGSDVSISMSASPTTVAQGGNVTYTLTPRLNGGIAPGSTGSGIITVTDTLGAGLTFVSAAGAGWTCAAAGQVVTCTRPGPYPGGNYTDMPAITLVASATAAGSLSNKATISIPETDLAPGNNTANLNVTSSNSADLRLTKTANRTAVLANEAFSYTLKVSNLGPLATAATQTITVTDTVPAGLAVTAQPSGTGWNCLPASGYPLAGPLPIQCERAGGLAVNADTPTITIAVKAQAGAGNATITNNACAALSGAGPVDSNNANDCSSVGVSRTVEQADLQLVSKTASPNPVNAGETLTYVISVRNNGPDAATDVVVSDTLPSLVGTGGFQSATPSQGACTPSGPLNTAYVELSCNLGTLAKDAIASVTVVVRPTVTATAVRSNTATINSLGVGDPNRNNNSASVTSTVNALVDLQASKTATPNPVRAGTPLTYVATVKNNGPSTALGVAMTDTLPANAAFLSLDGITGSGSCTTVPTPGQTGGTLKCGWAAIALNNQYTVTYKVRPLASAAGGSVVNSVGATTTTQEFNTTNNSAGTTTPVIAPLLDILINKKDSADPVLLGQPTTYTITINNAGPSYGSNVQMTDIFPAPPPASPSQATFSYEGGLTVDKGGVCVEPALGLTSGTLSCSFPGLSAGETATVTYKMIARTLTVPGAFAGTAYNQATVSIDETEKLYSNNQVLEGTTARRFSENADLGIAKTTTATTVAPGATIDYLITVKNFGPAASTSAQVIDALPAGATLVSAPGCTNVGGSLSCAVGALAVGASRSISVQLRLDPVYAGANPLVNTATLDSPGDPNSANNSASASTPVAGPNLYNADLALTKTTVATAVAPGGTIAYTLNVHNNGPQASEGASVGDTLPAGTTLVSAPGCAPSGGMIVCAVGPLANGADKTFTVTLKLDDIYAGANPLVNAASVSAPGDPNTANNNASASTPVAGPNLYNADLALTKTTTATTVAPGGTISYTLNVHNNGPQESVGASVSDPLPAGTTFVSGAGCTGAPGVVSCAVGPLANGADKAFTITLKLENVYGGAKPLVNMASVIAPGDPNPGNNNASASTTVAGPDLHDADLALSKTTTATTVAPGGTIAYALKVHNNGPQASDGATVSDTLPAGTTFVSGAGCTLTGSTLDCAVGPLSSGADKTFAVTLKLNDIYAGANPLVNSASLNAPGDPNTGNNSASASTPVAGPNLHDADLALTKTTTATTVAPGGTISYTLKMHNNGPQESVGATVSDTLPAGTTFVSGAGCTLTGSTLDCAVGPLANGADKTFTITLKLNDIYGGANPLVNLANLSAPGDPDTSNNNASASTPVAGPNLYNADLALTKTTASTTVAPGGTIVYTLTVHNNGPQASDGASISDPLPGGATLAAAPGCTPSGGLLVCAVGPLANGADKTFTITLKLDDIYNGANPLVNTASLSAPGDPNTGNNGASASTSVAGPNLHNADLALTKTTNATTVAPGGTIAYTLNMHNNGPQASDGAILSDTLPAGTSFISGAGCTYAGGTVSCAVGPLANGASRAFNIELKLNDVYGGANPLVNSASLNAPGDPDTSNNNASASTPVAGPNLHDADLALSKTTTATTVAPGGTISYTLTVHNNGPQASDGASVTDSLPTGTTFVSGAGCANAGGTVSCAVSPLSSGADKAFTITLKLNDVYAGANPLVNSANLSAPGDPDTANNSASASTPVAGPNLHDADLALAIGTSATAIAPGGTISYTLTVTNNGPQASDGATVRFTLPTGTAFVSGTGCSLTGTSVECAVGPLANGANKVFTVQLRLDDVYGGAAPLVLSASVNAPGDPVLANNDASVSTPVAGPNLHNADLALAKTTPAASVAPGGTIAYTLTVTNNGPQESVGATLTDTLPAGTTFVSGAGCANAGGSVSCAIGPLANGASKTFTVTLKLDDGYSGASPLVNTASVNAPGDPNTGNNSAAASTPVQSQAAGVSSIPTLSEWAMLLLAALMAVMAMFSMRQRGRR